MSKSRKSTGQNAKANSEKNGNWQVNTSKPVKLHLGCGFKILEGYINIDLYSPVADLKLDITNLADIPDDSVDEIYLNAVFEHLYCFEHRKALAEWRRVLKMDGTLIIKSLPDFDEIMRAYVNRAPGNLGGDFDIEEVSRYTHGAYCADNKLGQIHKDIFNKQKIASLLEGAGFQIDTLESVCWGSEPNPVNIDVTSHKVPVEKLQHVHIPHISESFQPANPVVQHSQRGWLGQEWNGEPVPNSYRISINGVEGELLFGDVQYLFEKARTLPTGGTIVEIGSFMGLSSIIMANGLFSVNNDTARIHCIDTWAGSPEHQEMELIKSDQLYNTFLDNVERAGVTSLIKPLRKASADAAPEFADHSIDMIYVDGDHSYDGCYTDLNAWYPKLKNGGVIFGHDCAPESGVRKAVEQFADEHGLTYAILESPSSHYMFQLDVPQPNRASGLGGFVPAKEPDKANFAAVYCVYDDSAWLSESIESVYDSCEAVYFLVGTKPWQGSEADNSKTLEIIRNYPDPDRKIRLFAGNWSSETEQRNAGLDIAWEAGFVFNFVVDADEIYDSSDLRRMMGLAANHPEIDCWHMSWDTYWKSPNFRIEPREPFKPVVFVKTGARFSSNRAVEVGAHGLMPPEVGFCHHMSYARTDDEILRKITTFSHADEIQQGWFENVWKRWDANNSITNLHPTHPAAYGRTVRQASWALPEALKKYVQDDSATELTSIIILTHNQLEYTRKCLDSIELCTPEPHEVIIVDNASTDGTVDYLKAKAEGNPNYRVIFNDENLGFAAGNNQGMAAADGDNVVLLNNDVVVTPRWLERMLVCAAHDSSIGIVGPMTNHISGPQLVEQPLYDEESLGGLDQFSSDWARKQSGDILTIWRVVGFCMLIKRDVIDKIGGLDTLYGMGNFEDDDYCVRAMVAGFRCAIAKGSFVHHFGSKSFAAANIDYNALLHNNWELFKNKWGLPADLRYGAIYEVSTLWERPFDAVGHYCALDGKTQNHSEAYEKQMGIRAFADSRWPEAIQHIENTLKSDPTDIEALNALALAHGHSGNGKKARAILKQATDTAPNHPDAYQNLAIMLAQQGRVLEAAVCACQAVEVAGDNAAARQNLVALRQMVRSIKPAPRGTSKTNASTQTEIDSVIRRIDAALGSTTPVAAPVTKASAKKPTLSVCLIAKDEEQFLTECLESIKDIADEIVFVDTGSKDRTRDIAKSFGANIYDFKWNDNYSDARNSALDKAKCDWVLFMDADERLDKDSQKIVLDALKDRKMDAYDILFYNYDSDTSKPYIIHRVCRLHRNKQEYRYSGRIHESVGPSIVEHNGPARELDAIVHHYGYRSDLIKDRNKHERYTKMLQAELKEKPNDIHVLHHLGGAYCAEQQFEEAIPYLIKETELTPSQHPHVGLAYARLANAYWATEKISEAVDTLERAQKKGVVHPEVTFTKGNLLLAREKYQDAIQAFEEAIRLGKTQQWLGDPNTFGHKAVFGIARGLVGLEDYRGAVEKCKKVLSEKADHPHAEELIALSYVAMGQPDKAEPHWRELLRLAPGSATALSHLASFYESREDNAQLKDVYLQKLASGQDSAELRYRIALCHEALGEVDEAQEQYLHIIEINPDMAPAHCDLGRSYAAQNRLQEAIDCYAKALEIDSSYANAYFNAGDVLYVTGDYEKAADFYQSGIMYAPNHAQGYFALGNCYFQQGSCEAAAIAYRQAIAIQPEYHDAISNLSLAQEEMSRQNAA